MRDQALTRKQFVTGATLAAATVTAAFPAIIHSPSAAAETLKIGETDELTGTYAALGRSQQRGEQLAMERWNAKGGVLGRKVELVAEDNQADPGVAVQKARKLVNDDKCVALIGTVSSAVALATSNAAATLNTVFMDAGGHADDITGKNCHWTTFQVCHTTWALTHANGFAIAEKYGKKWYLITPDYAFGHALARGYNDVIQKVGGQIVENDLAPLGTTDFSTYLTKVTAKKPDVLVVLNNGNDFINTMKQASSFGILAKIPVAGPYAELEALWALPTVARVGFWGTEWYYKDSIVFGSHNAEALTFVNEYRKRFGEPPTARSCFGYAGMDRLLWAFNEAKSTDPVKVSKALAGAEFTSVWAGASSFRTQDHEMMWPMWNGTIRPQGTPQDKYDVIDVTSVQPAEKIFITAAEAAKECSLGYPG
ncbi:ABC transporter substrate-binding protein [bacterium]|nr:MAG: ABC transporter substrate-binding protein [bacterium]